MIDSSAEKIGDTKSLFCIDCERETTFIWAAWDEEEYLDCPPVQEYGWECTACGSRFANPEL